MNYDFTKKRLLESLTFNQGISMPVPYLNKAQFLKFQDMLEKICLENILSDKL